MQQGEGGFVRDYRSTLDWEWFTDVNTAHLWEYIRLRVNYEPSRFRGMEIKRGQMLESIDTMAKRTGLTYSQVRTALKHLKKTGEVACTVTRYGMLISAVKYDDFQTMNRHLDTQLDTDVTRRSQGDDTEIATYKEIKEIKEEKERKEDAGASPAKAPPTAAEVKSYADSIGYEIDADRFCDYYTENGWVKKDGMPIRDWRATVRSWQRRDKKKEEEEKKNEKPGRNPEPEFNFSTEPDWMDD